MRTIDIAAIRAEAKRRKPLKAPKHRKKLHVHWTYPEIRHASELHDKGYTWSEIGLKLNRRSRGVQARVLRWRKGQ
jgi:hypothetical protein